MDGAWRPSGVVTLLTDFGHADPYVGIVKGVLYRDAPALRAVVDLAHELEPEDVTAAAFVLRHAWSWFPVGSVHVAVVDPEVGSERAILVARAGGHAFLAPDNGLLAPLLRALQGADVRRLDVEGLGLAGGSRTFHGRDRFAPAAALLASGRAPETLGPALAGWRGLALPEPRPDGAGALRAEVLWVDRFGNLVTNAPGDPAALPLRAEVAGRVVPFVATYAAAEPGALVALVDSFGLCEVAVRGGSAARTLGLGRGASVRIVGAARG
jgi:S-adenosylmethionine hydrolase